MALLLGSHNGVHCCGTVGDLNSRSQLSAVKHTFMVYVVQKQNEKKQIKFKISINEAKKIEKFALFCFLKSFCYF